jgi:membrane protein implicated in regulation of membrane protease activity
MFRTVFAVGAMAIIGIVALKLMFGIFGALVALFFVLFFWALKLAVIGFIVYLIIRLLSPDTARKIKENLS